MKLLMIPPKTTWLHFFAGLLVIAVVFEFLAMGFPTLTLKGIRYTLNWSVLKLTSMLILAMVISDKIGREKKKR